MKPIYLDYNATTPILPEVSKAMQPFILKYFGNPSSSHWYGVQTNTAIEKARHQVARLLNCNVNEIVFTSGGSESNNYAIKGTAFANRAKGNHIITSSVEHPAVIEVCKYLESMGFKITYIPVDQYGVIDPGQLEKSITSSTILISIMHANNEVGTIQPIKEISEIAQNNKIIFHTDAAQSIGKINTDVKELGVDLLSVAGHKLYAPKGIGALYIKNGIKLEKLIHGAKQEKNRRAGTENIMQIVGLGEACRLASDNLKKNFNHLKKMRDRLENGLKKAHKDQKINGTDLIKINGHAKQRLPNTLSISFYGIESNKLLSSIENIVAVSTGSACHAGGVHVSDTLKAMNVPKKYAMGTLRISTGKMTTEQEIDKAIDVITKAVNELYDVCK